MNEVKYPSNDDVLDSNDSDRVGDPIRIDRGGGTQSIVGEGVMVSQLLVELEGDVLEDSEGLSLSCERQEFVSELDDNVKDDQSSSNGSALRMVNL